MAHSFRSILFSTLLAAVSALVLGWEAHGQSRFSDLVGPVEVGPMPSGKTLSLPYITWGGDTATFHANGGTKTAKGSIFDAQGLSYTLKAGDDFVQQVRDYMAGDTPFLRGTFRMIGQASEVIGSDPRTKGVVIMQMTWSAGDHMVGRGEIRSLDDIKGKTICLQQGGPHVGMLDDILDSVKLSWNDVRIRWVKDLSGANGPAEAFRNDSSIDACFVISPDMIGLTGGLEEKGTGAEGTVKGSRVVVSTADLSRSIADVYVCRKDYYDANRVAVQKFVAGYLKGCEEVMAMRKQWEARGSKNYENLLRMTQRIYGEDVIPTLEEDAHGLIADCTFVGYPGNKDFFTLKNNPRGFERFQQNALDLAMEVGYARVRSGLFAPAWDWNSGLFLDYLAKTESKKGDRFKGAETLETLENLKVDELDDRTLFSFTINFEPNQIVFSEEAYGIEFQRVAEEAAKYGNAVVNIRGHADPTQTLIDVVKSGMSKGVLERRGTSGNYRYFLQGQPLDLKQTTKLLELVEDGAFDGSTPNPRMTAQAALNLSRKRAEAVRASILAYAKKNNVPLEPSQIQPVGVGIREPLNPRPRNSGQARENMRVEFRIVRVPAEVLSEDAFDF